MYKGEIPVIKPATAKAIFANSVRDSELSGKKQVALNEIFDMLPPEGQVSFATLANANHPEVKKQFRLSAAVRKPGHPLSLVEQTYRVTVPVTQRAIAGVYGTPIPENTASGIDLAVNEYLLGHDIGEEKLGILKKEGNITAHPKVINEMVHLFGDIHDMHYKLTGRHDVLDGVPISNKVVRQDMNIFTLGRIGTTQYSEGILAALEPLESLDVTNPEEGLIKGRFILVKIPDQRGNQNVFPNTPSYRQALDRSWLEHELEGLINMDKKERTTRRNELNERLGQGKLELLVPRPDQTWDELNKMLANPNAFKAAIEKQPRLREFEQPKQFLQGWKGLSWAWYALENFVEPTRNATDPRLQYMHMRTVASIDQLLKNVEERQDECALFLAVYNGGPNQPDKTSFEGSRAYVRQNEIVRQYLTTKNVRVFEEPPTFLKSLSTLIKKTFSSSEINEGVDKFNDAWRSYSVAERDKNSAEYKRLRSDRSWRLASHLLVARLAEDTRKTLANYRAERDAGRTGENVTLHYNKGQFEAMTRTNDKAV